MSVTFQTQSPESFHLRAGKLICDLPDQDSSTSLQHSWKEPRGTPTQSAEKREGPGRRILAHVRSSTWTRNWSRHRDSFGRWKKKDVGLGNGKRQPSSDPVCLDVASRIVSIRSLPFCIPHNLSSAVLNHTLVFHSFKMYHAPNNHCLLCRRGLEMYNIPWCYLVWSFRRTRILYHHWIDGLGSWGSVSWKPLAQIDVTMAHVCL